MPQKETVISRYAKLASSVLKANQRYGYVDHSQTCHVDSLIQFRDLKGQKSEKVRSLVITKWFDLGDGIDPKDSLWRTHILSYPEVKPKFHREANTNRNLFEDQPGLSLEGLTLNNEQLLREEKFREDLRLFYRDHWVEQSRKS